MKQRRGRPKTLDKDQIDRDILKLLDLEKTASMKLGYPTRRVWQWINARYRRNYSRTAILRRLKSLEERHLIRGVFKHRRYYWRAQLLPFRINGEFATWEQILAWRKEFKKLGIDREDVESFYKMMNDEIPFRAYDITRFSPEVLLSLKQRRDERLREKERKKRKKV